MQIVDARGLSCSEPVVMTRKAMAGKEPSYQVLVDAVAVKENVTRFAMSQGFTVNVSEDSGEFTLNIAK